MKKYLASALNTFRGIERTPRSDWHAILLAFTALIVVALVVDALLSYRLLSTPESAATPSTKPSLSREGIRTTVSKVRQSDADAAIVPAVVLRDPSL